MNEAMHKEQLVKKVAKETRLSQRLVSDVLKETFRQITSALADKGQVTFMGFGSFYTRQRKASEVKSPQTGKAIKVPAMRLAVFRAGALLKKAVRRSK